MDGVGTLDCALGLGPLGEGTWERAWKLESFGFRVLAAPRSHCRFIEDPSDHDFAHFVGFLLCFVEKPLRKLWGLAREGLAAGGPGIHSRVEGQVALPEARALPPTSPHFGASASAL